MSLESGSPTPEEMGIEISPEQIERSREEAAEIVLQDGGVRISTSISKELSPKGNSGFQNLDSRMNSGSNVGADIERRFLTQDQIRKGVRLNGSLEEHNIREIIDINRAKALVYETVTIPGKKGVFGIGKTPDIAKSRSTGKYRPVMHNEIVSNGKKEAAVRFSYYIPQTDWKDYSGRTGQMLAVEIILPESNAQVVEQIIKSDPAAIRRIVERVMKEKLLKDPTAWETPQGAGDPLCPPYEKWDAESGGTIYVQKEGDDPGFHQESVKEIKK